MPVRRKRELLKDYVKRCIPMRQEEHPSEPIKQSVAACYGMGREWWTPEKRKKAIEGLKK